MATEEEAELKELVIQTLENNGVLSQIRAKLRASVFLALENSSENQVINGDKNDFQQYLSTNTGKVVVGLIMDFLKHFKLESTLSVFESESQCGSVLLNDEHSSLATDVGISLDEANEKSILSALVIKYRDLISETKNREVLPTYLPLQKVDEVKESKPIAKADFVEELPSFSEKIDSEHSGHSISTNKSLNENKVDSLSLKSNSNSAQSNSKHLALNTHGWKSDGGGKSTGFNSLSSLNNAPPLPGLKGQFPPLSYENVKQKSNQSSKQSGENVDYEDDFQSSLSVNSLMKSDLNNSIDEEIEENILGNVDEMLSYEGVSDEDGATSDRTVSHISTTGIDYLESIG